LYKFERSSSDGIVLALYLDSVPAGECGGNEEIMSVGRFSARNVAAIYPIEAVEVAAERMAAHEVGAIMVVEDGKPVGVVTDRDRGMASFNIRRGGGIAIPRTTYNVLP
jgi:predicted transcriptional regulator